MGQPYKNDNLDALDANGNRVLMRGRQRHRENFENRKSTDVSIKKQMTILPDISTTTTLKIAIGTTNKAKISAVHLAFEKILHGSDVVVHVSAFDVASGVSAQPMSDSETMEGAQNRAKNALKMDPDAHYGIGIEAGVQKMSGRWFQGAWIVVCDRNGKIGIGSSSRYQLSDRIMERLLKHEEELADVMDNLSGECNVRSNKGAMGILTNGAVERAEAYSHGVAFAFAPFMSDPKFW